jgi:hypothetical protein
LTIGVRRLEITRNPDPSLAAGITVPSDQQSLDVTVISANKVWRAQIGLHRVSDRRTLAGAPADTPLECVIGDVNEVTVASDGPPYVNATLIKLSWRSSKAWVSSSLTGLPPVFVFRAAEGSCVSCPFFPENARGSLEPDPDGIADTLRWGHPIDGRTLFVNLTAVAANSVVAISSTFDLAVQASEAWPDASFSSLSREDIVHEQAITFGKAAARLDTEGAFVSLSGGLDSRTSLVALLSHGRRVPCITMAGSPDSLDARLAGAYCRVQGLPHHTVLLDEHFEKRVPDLLMRSAELTGGVACLMQTADLFLNENLPAALSTRISGNLGNQVGRGGVESLSVYQPIAEVFSSTIRERLAQRPLTPWFIPRLAERDYGETLFGQEVPFWSIPNYVVGSSRALQLTPYADRHLLLLSRAAFARDSELRQPSRKILRKRDVRHRILGTPRTLSFQRQFIAQHDQLGRNVPLNWGWRAGGGSSFRWRWYALGSAADAAMIKLGGRPGPLIALAKWASGQLGHRSALVDWPGLLKGRLREMALDTVTARSVREAGVFDYGALGAMMKRHFAGRDDCHLTAIRAFELALGISARASQQVSQAQRPWR